MTVDARGVGFAELNERIRESKEENVNIVGCLGQRFIACGMSDKHVTIDGVPATPWAHTSTVRKFSSTAMHRTQSATR